jgi:hypothetical protein
MKTEAVHGHRENALDNTNREIRNPPRDWIAADTNRHGRRRRRIRIRSTAMLLQYSKRNLGRDEKENEKPPQHSSSSYQQTKEQRETKTKEADVTENALNFYFFKIQNKIYTKRRANNRKREPKTSRARSNTETKQNKKLENVKCKCVESMTNGVEKSPEEH